MPISNARFPRTEAGRAAQRGSAANSAGDIPQARAGHASCTRPAAIVAALALLLLFPLRSQAAQAPQSYRVLFETSRGAFTIAVDRAQAPHGADRFYALVRSKHFDGARFFRVVPGFVVQWGYAATPAASKAWSGTIPDDKVVASNTRGTITFAATGEPNSRNQQVFINYADNARLDAMGFAPFGKVVSGMDVVDHLYSGDGESPDQAQIAESGNAYLVKQFPKLDYIKTARIVP